MTVGCDRTPLDRSFFDRPVLQVAPDLLGRILVRSTPQGPIEVRLTEVEAYAGASDPGSHCYRGRTERNASMFGPPGHAYVYFTYGMWHCLNLVCDAEGTPSGVLLRAGEIIRGQELARPRRAAARKDRELAQGPARLATALDVGRVLNGTDVCAGPQAPLSVLHGDPVPADHVLSGPRTGVGGEGATHPWRFWIADDPTVSPYRAHVPRRRNRSASTTKLDARRPGA
ncbi:DNA-3-methyladenine glycosylase [Streptomyces sp. 71268]|uniref:DNA-3-methyladenine glycosylase n=1 Tax=Streptomyces sp. 71268 TaxID=3002640 RepID=UPI0023F7AF86|nr:DNA-3-methyladenine glycosylase [Streptomyces sp. 71268]WEV28532.1 DNA-3-methyladenine glycosylase [Streptomyces sp. 71268]